MKKTLKELSITILILVILFATGLNVPLAGFVQGLILKTGLLSPETNKIERLEAFDYQLVLKNEQNEFVDVKDLKGKTLFINFWATWCPPCIAEMPEIEELYHKASSDVEFLIISVDQDFEKALKFKNKKGFSIPVYHIASALPSTFRGNSIPRTYVVGSNGDLAYEHTGMAGYSSDDFVKFISEL